jgi:predicted DNA-binding antitoxin AbrB/MazE fold protein
MTKIIEATFDGVVFRPAEPFALEPNTTVRLTVEISPKPPEETVSFLDVASSLHLEGPPDWATNLDKYLYGEESSSGR